jgi:hypothetical protein
MTSIGWRQEALNASGFGQRQRPNFNASLTFSVIPGVYAFVVDGRIFYIGKATRLRSRLRGYNRSLWSPERIRKELRRAHRGIGKTVKADGIVDVWIYEHSGSEATIERLEAERSQRNAPHGTEPEFLRHCSPLLQAHERLAGFSATLNKNSRA